MGKAKLKPETKLAVIIGLKAGESPREISTRLGISDSSVSRIKTEHLPKDEKYKKTTPFPAGKQLEFDIPAAFVPAAAHTPASTPSPKRYKTLNFGGNKISFPEDKNYHYIVNENNELIAFDVL